MKVSRNDWLGDDGGILLEHGSVAFPDVDEMLRRHLFPEASALWRQPQAPGFDQDADLHCRVRSRQ